MARRIELLAGRHRRGEFDCGEENLNKFLRQQAGQQQRRGFGKTYVVVGESDLDVTGFITVSVGQVATQTLPSALKLPRYPAPVLRIGRLAVDKRVQGKGIGQELLSFALHLALEFSERTGLYAVVVDAKNESAATFYRGLHFHPTVDNRLCLYLPLSQLVKSKADSSGTRANR